MILSEYGMNQRIEQQARERALKAQPLTPQHSAAEAAMESQDGDEDQADPYPPDAPEVVHADLDKVHRDAVSVPAGYPPFGQMSAEAFHRGPIVAGEAAYSPGYATSARPVPVPSSTLSAAAIARPLMTDGRARPSAEG